MWHGDHVCSIQKTGHILYNHHLWLLHSTISSYGHSYLFTVILHPLELQKVFEYTLGFYECIPGPRYIPIGVGPLDVQLQHIFAVNLALLY